MKIIISYYDRDPITLDTFYSKRHYKEFIGNTAAECMKQIELFRNNHDCTKYTATEIYNVLD